MHALGGERFQGQEQGGREGEGEGQEQGGEKSGFMPKTRVATIQSGCVSVQYKQPVFRIKGPVTSSGEAPYHIRTLVGMCVV